MRTEASLFFFVVVISCLPVLVFVAACGLSLVVVRGLLIAGSGGAWALPYESFGSCGAGTQLLHGMWDLPGPGIKPTSPALTGRFLPTGPPKRAWLVCPEQRTWRGISARPGLADVSPKGPGSGSVCHAALLWPLSPATVVPQQPRHE